jgi:hypothetical protein
MTSFTNFDTGEIVHPLAPNSDEKRQTPARRATDTNLEIIAHKTTRMASEFTEFKGDMHKAIDRLEASMRYNHATLTEAIHRAAEVAANAEVAAKESVHHALDAAFPDGDPEGHRRHHEAVIKKAEESAEFWATMRKEIGKWGLISVIGFLAVSAWQSFLQGPHK